MWLTAFGLAVGITAFYHNGLREILHNGLVNSGLLIFMLACVTLYWRVKYGVWHNPVDRSIGLGDIIFMSLVSILFDLRSYLIFLLISMIFSIAWWGVYTLWSKKETTVPFIATTGIILTVWLANQTLGL